MSAGLGGQVRRACLLYQTYLDQTVPHVVERWVGLAVLMTVFMLRILMSQGWYVICYAYFIFLLNLFIAFLSPKFDPSIEEDIRSQEAEEGGQLPSNQTDDFRPFIRRLPEFQFWHSAVRASVLALVASFIPVLDLPVFWPILVMYFLILVVMTMRRQINHMIKYHYIPFDFGKKKFGTK